MISEAELDRLIDLCLFEKRQIVKSVLKNRRSVRDLIELDIELRTLIKIRYTK